MGTPWANKAPSFSKVVTHEKRWRSCQCQWSIALLEVLLPSKIWISESNVTHQVFSLLSIKARTYIVQRNLNLTKGKGTGQMRSLKGGFVILRFFSIHFTITGANGSLGTLSTDNGNSNGNGHGNTVKETGKITRFGLTGIANYEQLISSAKTANSILLVASCEKSSFFHLRFFFRRRPGISIWNRWFAGAGYFFKDRARGAREGEGVSSPFLPRASSRFLPSP